jgi:hypothetical protein
MPSPDLFFDDSDLAPAATLHKREVPDGMPYQQ